MDSLTMQATYSNCHASLGKSPATLLPPSHPLPKNQASIFGVRRASLHHQLVLICHMPRRYDRHDMYLFRIHFGDGISGKVRFWTLNGINIGVFRKNIMFSPWSIDVI